MSRRKDIAKLITTLEEEGWTVTHTGGGHWRCAHPNASTVVYLPSSPSDQRSIHNARAKLRRSMKDIPAL